MMLMFSPRLPTGADLTKVELSELKIVKMIQHSTKTNDKSNYCTENTQDDSTLHQYWEKSNHPNPTLLWKGITHPAPCQLWWVPAGESKLLLRAFTCRIHHFNYIHHIHCFNCYHPQIGNATFTVSNHKLAKHVISTPCEICPGQSRQF